MALFVEIQVDDEVANDAESVKQLAEVCTVDIFVQKPDGSLEIDDANVDECTLCELCLAVGSPGQVRVKKLYDDVILQRSA